MEHTTPTVVIDTYVIYSGLYSRRGASFQLISRLGTGLYEISLSVPVVLEYEELLLSKRQGLGLSTDDVSAVLDYMCSVATLHDIYFLWRPILRDPDDEMALELAVRAECSHIVTYNQQDFVAAGTFDVEVITPKQLLQEVGVLL